VEENFSLFTGNYYGTNKPTNLIKESAETTNQAPYDNEILILS